MSIILTTDHVTFARLLFGPPPYAFNRQRLLAARRQVRLDLAKAWHQRQGLATGLTFESNLWASHAAYFTTRAMGLSRLVLVRQLLQELAEQETQDTTP